MDEEEGGSRWSRCMKRGMSYAEVSGPREVMREGRLLSGGRRALSDEEQERRSSFCCGRKDSWDAGAESVERRWVRDEVMKRCEEVVAEKRRDDKATG